MCALCGSLSGGAHWSDGAPDEEDPSPPAWRRRAARRQRVTSVNRVLRRCGLALSDWQGSVFLLRGRTGAAAEIADFGALWAEADRLGTKPADPLDPRFLHDLARDGG